MQTPYTGEPLDRSTRCAFGHSYFAWCRFHEADCKWVAEETWRFNTTFNANKTSFPAAHFDLALIGVDTVAEVLINGQLVAQLSNAFRYCNNDILVLAGHMFTVVLL